MSLCCRVKFRVAALAGLFAAGSFLSLHAGATEAGLRMMTVPLTANDRPAHYALYYPSDGASHDIPMGPFPQHVAMNAPPQAQALGLIVISHGTAATEIAFATLAQALARAGYLVASVEHVGDTWEDQSMRADLVHYFAERPRQVSRVIDAVLADPGWRDRIRKGADGQPLVGAMGHSAGGYTVLALEGGQPDPKRLRVHCELEAALDPVLCRLVGSLSNGAPAGAALPASEPVVPDRRVRAVMALAPLGVMFDPGSLASIRIPVAIYAGEKDTFLVPRFHALWVAQQMDAETATLHSVGNAGHYAFMDRPSFSLPSPDGDVAGDPTGFDRAAFLQQLGADAISFFGAHLH